MNANVMQIQTMTQIQTKNPAAYLTPGLDFKYEAASFIKAICILFKITIE